MSKATKPGQPLGLGSSAVVRPRGAMRDYVAQNWKREAQYVADIEYLRDWIKRTGLMVDICTLDVLGDVCENCRCKRAPKGPNVRAKPDTTARDQL